MRIIDADALKDKIIAEDDGTWSTAAHFIRDIDSAPTISGRKHGKWVHSHGDEWYCSECLYTISTEGSWEHPKDTGNDFCKHCGAEMEGANNDKI